MRDSPNTNDRLICAALFATGTALLVYGSLVPFRFRSISFADAAKEFTALFQLPMERWGESADWSLNLTVMIPIAFFAMGAIVDGRKRRLAWLATPLVVLACVAISLAVEFGQVWCAGRVASSRDVVAQTLGAGVGAIIWLVAGERYSIWRRSFAARRGSQHRLEWVLQAYLIGLAIYSVIPVNLVMSPAELAKKYRSGVIELVPFTYRHEGLLDSLYSALTDVLLFVPVGMCTASAWNRRGQSLRPAPKALLYGLLYTAGLEVAQLFVVGRYVSSTDVILGFAGVAAGVFAMRWWRRESQTTHREAMPDDQIAVLWLLGALAYIAFLAVIYWAPFEFTNNVDLVKSRLSAFIEVPFARMHAGSDAVGMFAAIRKVLWLVPLGVICGLTLVKLPTRFRRMLSFAMAAAILVAALSIEIGQVLLPDRTANSTDVMLSAIGGIAGLWMTIVVAR